MKLLENVGFTLVVLTCSLRADLDGTIFAYDCHMQLL